jgi:hypothetical protein
VEHVQTQLFYFDERAEAGEGRLARPKFRYTGSVSFGYDDNILQTPTNSPGTPDTVVTVVGTLTLFVCCYDTISFVRSRNGMYLCTIQLIVPESQEFFLQDFVQDFLQDSNDGQESCKKKSAQNPGIFLLR